MSLVLPGNTRELRFSGEVQALDVPADALPPVVLGRPRVRRERRSPPVDYGTAQSQLSDVVTVAASPPPPALESRASTSPWPEGDWNPSPRELERRSRMVLSKTAAMPVVIVPTEPSDGPPSLRRKFGELVSRWPQSKAIPVLAKQPDPAIPLFRSAEEIEADRAEIVRALAERQVRVPRHTRTSLAIWIAASVLVGVLSYQIVSRVITRPQPAVVTAAR